MITLPSLSVSVAALIRNQELQSPIGPVDVDALLDIGPVDTSPIGPVDALPLAIAKLDVIAVDLRGMWGK